MAPTEMIQASPLLSQARLNTPPNSPNLLPSSDVSTLNSVYQFMVMINAIVAMQTAPTALAPYCSCSHTPLGSPTPQTPSTPLTVEYLERLFLKLTQEMSKSPDSIGVSEAAKPEALEDTQPKKAVARASKLEFKTVDEVWNDKEYKYKIVESLTPTGVLDELDEYVFVVRMRIDKKTSDQTFHIDIKSEGLQNILRTVLREVKGICLRGDKPTVERNLLYNYLAELEAYRSTVDSDTDPSQNHLDLLIDYIKKAYTSTTQRLVPLLENGEITYDLLWALFKPNTVAFTACPGTKKPRCIKYDFGEERTMINGIEYFHVEGRYLDFDGKVFGEVSVNTWILRFRGTKPINTLNVFPLQYHQNENEIKKELTDGGRKFVSLMGAHHLQYRGAAFRMEEGEPVAVFVSSRIMVDAAFFRKINPNYTRPAVNGAANRRSGDPVVIDLFDLFNDPSISQPDEAKINSVDLDKVDVDDLLLCSPTVLGFSLDDKMWLEFAVADITDIDWNFSLFDHLAIQHKQKKLIQALATSHISQTPDHSFDDFVAGKGRGLIMLFYGPPGVGKTLTAEGLSDHLQRPLYTISAGDLSNDPKLLEQQLSRIFELADHWKALLLLDEADVYLRQRSLDHVHNSLVSVFLRKLEYYQGIMFLTTNRVTDFDEAIQSRIHVTLKYKDLGVDTRKGIWKNFLKKATTTKGEASYNPEQLYKLAKKTLNGRQIKNAVRAAHALASLEGARLSYSHLEAVIDSGAGFESDFRGAGQIANLNNYV